jgi:hypothetical protein
MKKNVGTIDMMIRLLIALAIIVLYFTNVISGTLAVILFIIAAIMVLTSIFGICPAWMLFGISTCKKEEKK